MGRQPVSIFKVAMMQHLKIMALLFCLCIISGCEDFLTGENLYSNPNKVGDVDQVSVEALFVGSQVTLYLSLIHISEPTRLLSIGFAGLWL